MYILGQSSQEQVDQAYTQIFPFIKPKVFHGPNSEEAKLISGYQETFIRMMQHIPKDAREMTVLEFYKTLEILNKKNG